MGDPEGLRQRASRPVEKQSDHETEAQLTVNKPVENVNNYRKLLFLTILSTAGTFALVGFQLFSRDGGTGSAHQFLFFYIIVPFTILLYILLFCINTHPINSVFLIMILCINSLALGVLLQTSFQVREWNRENINLISTFFVSPVTIGFIFSRRMRRSGSFVCLRTACPLQRLLCLRRRRRRIPPRCPLHPFQPQHNSRSFVSYRKTTVEIKGKGPENANYNKNIEQGHHGTQFLFPCKVPVLKNIVKKLQSHAHLGESV